MQLRKQEQAQEQAQELAQQAQELAKLKVKLLETKLTLERFRRLTAESKNSTRGLFGKSSPVTDSCRPLISATAQGAI